MRTLLLFVPILAMAQAPTVKHRTVTIEGNMAGGADNVHFVAAAPTAGVRMFSFSPTPVKGAPYSAEAINERVQTLPDGNRITEKSTTKMFRDSEGRTRTETALGPIGNWTPENGRAMVFIDDPVGGFHYTLNPTQKTAMKMVMPKHAEPMGEGAGGVAGRIDVEKRVVVAESGQTVTENIVGPAMMSIGSAIRMPLDPNAPKPTQTVTSLGKRTMEGVEVEGSRTVDKFPAGMFGNERPLEVTMERWYSNDLKVEVLRKHTDPRFGETTYRLSNLLKGEQPRSLFEPPSDYKVEESKMRTLRDKVVREKDPTNGK